jgi:hypothetical protein
MVTPLCPTPAATRTFRLSVARFPVQRAPSPPSPPDSLAWTTPRNKGERAAASSQVKVSFPLPDPTRSGERLVGVLVVVEVEPALERLSGGDARGGNRSGPGQGEPPPPDPTRSDERLVGVLVVVEVEPALERSSGLQSELLRALLVRDCAH